MVLSRSFQNKKILVITTSYLFNKNDYHALFVHHMNQALLRYGAAHITVVTPMVPGGEEHEYMDGIEVKRFVYPGFREGQANPTGNDGIVENVKKHPLLALSLPLLCYSFLRHAQKEAQGHDLIISHWLLPSALIASLFPLPHIAIAHGSEVQLLSKLPLRTLLLNRILKRGQLHCTSSYLEKKLRAIAKDSPYSNQIKLSYLGVSVDQEKAESRSIYRPQETFRILFMGRILRSKGIGRLLDLLPCLEGCSLTFAGDGEDLPWLRQEITKRKLPAQALGPLRKGAKADVLANSHLFIFLPEESHRENLPISILEALAYGLPPLSVKKGGIEEILSHQHNSILFDRFNQQEIIQAIKSLQGDPTRWLQLSHNALTSARPFHWAERIARLDGEFHRYKATKE